MRDSAEDGFREVAFPFRSWTVFNKNWKLSGIASKSPLQGLRVVSRRISLAHK